MISVSNSILILIIFIVIMIIVELSTPLQALKLYNITVDIDLDELEVTLQPNFTVNNKSKEKSDFDNTLIINKGSNKIESEVNESSFNLRNPRVRSFEKSENDLSANDINHIRRSDLSKVPSHFNFNDLSANFRETNSRTLDSLEPYDSRFESADMSNPQFIEYQNDGPIAVDTTGESDERKYNQSDLELDSREEARSTDTRYRWSKASEDAGHGRAIDGAPRIVPSIDLNETRTTVPNTISSEARENLTSNPRYCSSPYNCHLHLNERCVPSTNYNVCQCVEPFHRTNDSDECRIKKGALITVHFGGLTWSDDLANIYSPRFIETKDKTEKSLRFIMNRSPLLSSGVVSIDVLSFNAGSVMAKAMIHVRNDLFANNFKVNLAREMTQAVNDLSRANSDAGLDLLKPQNEVFLSNVTIKAIQDDVDPCETPDLNYCSRNANCIPLTLDRLVSPGDLGFRCQCKPGYTDLSPNPYYPGEICRVECPLSYCENGGHCLVNALDSSLYCTCQDWSVGPRCQFSGILVFSVIGVVVILLMLIVACTASAFCGKRVTRETVFSRRVSPVAYDDTIRPFRISVNRYDSPQMSNGLLIGGNGGDRTNSGVAGKEKSLADRYKDECLSEQSNHLQGLTAIGLTQASFNGNHRDSEGTPTSGNKANPSSPASTQLNLSPEAGDNYRSSSMLQVPNKGKQNQQTQVTWF